MFRLGVALIVAGLFMMGYALFMAVGMEVPGEYVGSSYQPQVVANIDLIGQRTMLAQIGGVLFVGGWIAVGIARLRPIRRDALPD